MFFNLTILINSFNNAQGLDFVLPLSARFAAISPHFQYCIKASICNATILPTTFAD